MKLEEAIEELEGLSYEHFDRTYTNRTDALKLGIEAMKEIQRLTKAQQCHRPRLLPGETS